jgi:dihydroneopterin aldolase
MKIIVEGIKLHAYHGCLEQEARIGGEYIVAITLEADLSEAAKTDDLTKTIDYCDVYEIVQSEMAIRSKLIEQVGQRIMDQLKKKFKTLQYAEVKLTKLSPPINGDVEKVSVIINS